MHHKLCFNLFMLPDNLFDNQGTEKNKNDIFCTLRHTVFYEYFLPTLLYSLSLSLNWHRRTYRNGCEIFAQQKKCVFNNFWKRISHYYNNGFEEDIYIYISYINYLLSHVLQVKNNSFKVLLKQKSNILLYKVCHLLKASAW